MIRKYLILLMLCLFATSVNADTSNTVKPEKYTKRDYIQMLKDYTIECNKKLDSIDNEYYPKIREIRSSMQKMDEQKHSIYMKYSLCEENASWKELANGPCGHLLNKTTYLRTQSGFIVADDTYAVNKCLAKLPSNQKAGVYCKNEKIAWQKFENNYKALEKQLNSLETERKNKNKKLIDEATEYAQELKNQCIKTYPMRNYWLDYCKDLSITTK